MNWSRVLTNNGWRVFSDEISESYLKKTSSGRAVPEKVTEAFIDLPGMIPSDRTYQDVEIDGLTVTIPSMDFDLIHAMLKGAKVEIFPGGVELVKLRGFMEGLVLTLKQRDSLVAAMAEILPAVQIIGDRENKRFSEGIASIKEEAGIKSWRHEMVEAKEDKDVPKPN